MKRFDDIFAAKVKDAFSTYNADHLAGDAWNSFKKNKFRRRTGITIPLWAKAASVAVLLSATGLMVYKTFINSRESTDRQPVVAQTQNTGENMKEPGDDPVTDEKMNPAKDVSLTAPETAKDVSLTAPGTAKDVSLTAPETTKDVSLTASETAKDKPLPEKTSYAGADNTVDRNNLYPYLHPLPLPDGSIKLVINDVKSIIEEPPLYASFTAIMLEYDQPEKQKERTGLIAGLSGMIGKSDNDFSGNTGSSIGFYIERKLSGRFSFRPGIALAMQAYTLDDNFMETNMNYSAPDMNGVSGSIAGYEANLDLLAMEIPLNFVYTVWERGRSKLYISSGASTMVYLNQQLEGSFTSEYNRATYDDITNELTYLTDSRVVEVENNYGAFSHVDFFGLANFSAGYSVPLGKSNTVSVEPFVKFPVSRLTSLKLRTMYGGISLNLRFLH